MTMSFTQQIITIAVVVLGTMTTRFLPFLIFGTRQKTPAVIQYLGKVLPAAALGLLVVYSLKDVQLLNAPYGLPELLSVLLVVVLHLWRRNMFLSIAGGTVCYMVLLQTLFAV